jgi:hypothetical protein
MIPVKIRGAAVAAGIAAALIAFQAPIGPLAATASSETTHIYPVSLTIAVDRAAGKINGTIVTDAPSEFCDSSTVRVRIAMAGHDTVVARIFPYGGEWHMKSGPHLSGQRVYAEVLAYHLPARPVECLGARTRAVRAP